MTFFTSDTGAVTVDWVVLTAALVGLGLATMGVVSSGVENASSDVDAQLQTRHVYTSFAARNYSTYYEAVMRKNASDAVTGMSAGADFEATVAAFQAMDDATLIANIQIAAAGYDATVTQYDALEALDAGTVTAAQLATALGGTEASIQTAINNTFSGDASLMHEHLTAHFGQSARTQEFRIQLAEERGLTY